MNKILDSGLTKRNLLIASLFITSFETLKNSIQERIKSFLCIDATINKNGEFFYKISDDYKENVLNRTIPGVDKRKSREYHLFYSSCLWLKDMQAINDDDIEEVEKIRKHRNLIAHNPMKLLVDDEVNINTNLLKSSHNLISKIEKWWIINFEIQINPDFDGKEVSEDDVQSGVTIFIDYLMQIAEDEVNNLRYTN